MKDDIKVLTDKFNAHDENLINFNNNLNEIKTTFDNA